MISVYKKELSSYFTGMVGYAAVAMILIMTGIFVKIVSLDNGVPMLEYAFPTSSLILLLALPIIAMNSFAGEKQQKTDQLLYSLPFSSTQIVLGKYFSMTTLLLIPMGFLGVFAFVLDIYGSIDYFSTFSSLLVFYLLTCAMAGICMFMSSISESPLTSAVLSVGVLVAMYYSGTLAAIIPTTEVASVIAFSVLCVAVGFIVYAFIRDIYVSAAVTAVLEIIVMVIYYFKKDVFLGLIQRAVNAFSMFDRLDTAVRSQILDINTVVYFISVVVLFAFLTVQVVEKRRYS